MDGQTNDRQIDIQVDKMAECMDTHMHAQSHTHTNTQIDIQTNRITYTQCSAQDFRSGRRFFLFELGVALETVLIN